MVQKAMDSMPKAKLSSIRRNGSSCSAREVTDRATRSHPQVTVLRYRRPILLTLIARKVRELGVYAEVLPSETPASASHKPKRPHHFRRAEQRLRPRQPDPSTPPFSIAAPPSSAFATDSQLIGAPVGRHGPQRRQRRVRLATLEVRSPAGDRLFQGLPPRQQIWMSHRDTVVGLPGGFSVTGATGSCAVAAMAEIMRKLYGVQFHSRSHPHTKQARKFSRTSYLRSADANAIGTPSTASRRSKTISAA